MLIKKSDSKHEEIQELKSLLKCHITTKQRFLIERELKSLKIGVSGESDSAYYIDFYFAHSKNMAVIHDLRIEHENKVAQIDHLLINRFFDIYVIESKSYSYGIKITEEGEFQALNSKRYFGIASPIEQNKRHIYLLKKFFKDHAILPKRLGINIKPRLKSLILISPQSVIRRPTRKKFDTDIIIKADTLVTKIDKEAEKFNPLSDVASVTKLCSSSTVKETANRLVSYHKPIKINFRAKFGIHYNNNHKSVNAAAGRPKRGIANDTKPLYSHKPKFDSQQHNKPKRTVKRNSDSESDVPSKYYCADCGKTITANAAKYCWQHINVFNGKAYCYNCQKNYKLRSTAVSRHNG